LKNLIEIKKNYEVNLNSEGSSRDKELIFALSETPELHFFPNIAKGP
jgi:hypothetical protein